MQGCKKAHSKEKCTHERKYPELQNVSFFSFPKEAELRRKWFHFLRRKDIKSISQITSNHMICSFHFQGGLGYCKADPVPIIYNDPAMALCFNTNTTKRILVPIAVVLRRLGVGPKWLTKQMSIFSMMR